LLDVFWGNEADGINMAKPGEGEFASYEPDECPLCREGSAAVKPGSRFVRSAP
jgi:hypothetical protein